MASFKGILKYTIYFCIAVWMFVLGIMVGRGNAPVSFDTQQFQKRLEKIAQEFGEKDGKAVEKQIDLKFYKVLDHPVAVEDSSSKFSPKEILPVKKTSEAQPVPQKESIKKKTAKKEIRTVSKKEKRPPPEPRTAAENKGDGSDKKYTLQIAAYKRGVDAQAHIAELKKKGILAYSVKVNKSGVIWYRIRSGAFADLGAAKQYRKRLAKMKIDSMIIKKEKDENI